MKWNSFFRNQKKIEGDPIETVLPQCAKVSIMYILNLIANIGICLQTVVHQTDSASIINDKEVAGANADEEQISFNLCVNNYWVNKCTNLSQIVLQF